MRDGMYASNYTGFFNATVIDELKGAGLSFVNLQTYNDAIVRQQIETVKKVGGIDIALVYWLYPDNIRMQTEALHAVKVASDYGIENIAIDCEDEGFRGRTPTDITAVIRGQRNYLRDRGLNPGIYTRQSWWVNYVNTDEFKDCYLYAANYGLSNWNNNPPDISSGQLAFSGWEKVSILQWSATQNWKSQQTICRESCLDDFFAVPVPAPTDNSGPSGDAINLALLRAEERVIKVAANYLFVPNPDGSVTLAKPDGSKIDIVWQYPEGV